jgi:hypothetical protein
MAWKPVAGHDLIEVTSQHGGHCECGKWPPRGVITLPACEAWHQKHADSKRPPPPEPEPEPHLTVDDEGPMLVIYEGESLDFSWDADGRLIIAAAMEYGWTLDPDEVDQLRAFLDRV